MKLLPRTGQVSNYSDLKLAFANWGKQFRAKLNIING
jgi:hypothetical protein